MKSSRLIVVIAITIFVGVVLAVVSRYYFKKKTHDFFYPTAPPMPAEVTASMPEVLERLEQALAAKAPHVMAALQPGLSEDEIKKLETHYGVTLPNEIKSLYQWHNGTPIPTNTPTVDLFSIYHFRSLEDTLEESASVKKQVANQTYVQREIGSIFIKHRDSWICLFADGAGDGYYFDPQRQPNEGSVFYNFAEDGSYTFFPSIKNLLTAIAEGYEEGAFHEKDDADPSEAKVDYEAADEIWSKIWNKYSASNDPEAQ